MVFESPSLQTDRPLVASGSNLGFCVYLWLWSNLLKNWTASCNDSGIVEGYFLLTRFNRHVHSLQTSSHTASHTRDTREKEPPGHTPESEPERPSLALSSRVLLLREQRKDPEVPARLSVIMCKDKKSNPLRPLSPEFSDKTQQTY